MEKQFKIDDKKLKRCPSCGNFFTCHTDGDCWCHNYNITQKNRMIILNKYDDCLCPDCLKKYAEK